MTDIDINRIDQCEIRWSSTATKEIRSSILAKMSALPRARRSRRHTPNHAKARELAEARGLKSLLAPDVDADSSPERRFIVRIYYRSVGDETLAIETGPISARAASDLERDTSGALGTERWRADEPGRMPPLWRHARFVTLPSQSRDPVEIDAEVPASIQPTITNDSPREVAAPCSIFRAAMARRSQRIARWSAGVSLPR